MLSFLILCLLIIPIAAIYVYKQLNRSYRTYFLLSIASLFSILMIASFAAFKNYEQSLMLSVVPDALQVTSISYSKEESVGFGPGANEAGIRIYPLPSQIADRISQQGIAFFNNLPPNREWHGTYQKWLPTPITANDRWKPQGNLNIFDYICAYSVCIEIDDVVAKQATEIINNKGNYYAYGRIGLIVVSPSQKLVVYMYSG